MPAKVAGFRSAPLILSPFPRERVQREGFATPFLRLGWGIHSEPLRQWRKAWESRVAVLAFPFLIIRAYCLFRISIFVLRISREASRVHPLTLDVEENMVKSPREP